MLSQKYFVENQCSVTRYKFRSIRDVGWSNYRCKSFHYALKFISSILNM